MVTGFDCGPVTTSAGAIPLIRWSRPDTGERSSVHRLLRSRVGQLLARRNGYGVMSTNRGGTSSHQRQLALERANHVRVVRAGLKQKLRDGEVNASETILRCSHDTDTMTVTELLSSQRGWGPTRAASCLRSVLLSESKTLGSLTERQRLMLAAVLSIGESKEHSVRGRREG